MDYKGLRRNFVGDGHAHYFYEGAIFIGFIYAKMYRLTHFKDRPSTLYQLNLN